MVTRYNRGFVPAEQQVRATWPRNLEKDNEALELAAFLARRKPRLPLHLVALDARRLVMLAKSCASLSLCSCNRGLSDRQEKRWKKLGEQISQIAGWYGMTASTHGDPRGYVVRVDGPGVPKTGWGDGMGIA